MKFLVFFIAGLAAAAPFADSTHEGPETDDSAESYSFFNPSKPIGGLLGAAVGGVGGALAGTIKGGAEGATAGAAYGYGTPLPKGHDSPTLLKKPKMPKGLPKGLPLPPAGWGSPAASVTTRPAMGGMEGMNMK